MNNVTAIARNDATDLFRSNIVWVAIGAMTVLTLANVTAGLDTVRSASQPFLLVLLQFTLWIPLFAIIFGYNVVTGERESGRVRVLLGQPVRRRDIVLGKSLGRAAVLLFTAVIAIGLLFLLTFVQAGAIDPLEVVAGTFAVFLYALAWLGATIGVSAIAYSGKQVIGTMLVVYTTLQLLWVSFTLPILSLAVSGTSDWQSLITYQDLGLITYADGELWLLYAQRLNPSQAFQGSVFYSYELLRGGPSPDLGASGPHVFGLGVLFAWMVIPVLIGVWIFNRRDLH